MHIRKILLLFNVLFILLSFTCLAQDCDEIRSLLVKQEEALSDDQPNSYTQYASTLYTASRISDCVPKEITNQWITNYNKASDLGDFQAKLQLSLYQALYQSLVMDSLLCISTLQEACDLLLEGVDSKILPVNYLMAPIMYCYLGLDSNKNLDGVYDESFATKVYQKFVNADYLANSNKGEVDDEQRSIYNYVIGISYIQGRFGNPVNPEEGVKSLLLSDHPKATELALAYLNGAGASFNPSMKLLIAFHHLEHSDYPLNETQALKLINTAYEELDNLSNFQEQYLSFNKEHKWEDASLEHTEYNWNIISNSDYIEIGPYKGWKYVSESDKLGLILGLDRNLNVLSDKERVSVYKAMIESQDYRGLHLLGDAYYNGSGVLLDRVKAKDLFLQCYQKTGSTQAAYDYALCNDMGIGGEVNWDIAYDYYQKAKGYDSMVLVKLAEFHLFGLGGAEKDWDKAKELYLDAAKMGNNDAINALLVMEKLSGSYIIEQSKEGVKVSTTLTEEQKKPQYYKLGEGAKYLINHDIESYLDNCYMEAVRPYGFSDAIDFSDATNIGKVKLKGYETIEFINSVPKRTVGCLYIECGSGLNDMVYLRIPAMIVWQ